MCLIMPFIYGGTLEARLEAKTGQGAIEEHEVGRLVSFIFLSVEHGSTEPPFKVEGCRRWAVIPT